MLPSISKFNSHVWDEKTSFLSYKIVNKMNQISGSQFCVHGEGYGHHKEDKGDDQWLGDERVTKWNALKCSVVRAITMYKGQRIYETDSIEKEASHLNPKGT